MTYGFRMLAAAGLVCGLVCGVVFGPSVASPRPAPPADVRAAIAASARAMGMDGSRGRAKPLHAVELSGAGTMFAHGPMPTDFQISSFKVEADYAIPALRADLQLVTPTGRRERRVHVVSDGLAWDETAPGVGATAQPGGVDDRLRELWMTPHGAVAAALGAIRRGEPISLHVEGGRTVIALSLLGQPMRVLMGADQRPALVEFGPRDPVLGVTTFQAEYSDYADLDGEGVFCPRRIVERAAGRAFMAFDIRHCHRNAALQFNPPAARGHVP